MKVKITKPDGNSWFSSHVGEEFTVNRVTRWLGQHGFTSYEVNLLGRHSGAIAGTVLDSHCEVVEDDQDGFHVGLAKIRAQVAELEQLATTQSDNLQRYATYGSTWNREQSALRARLVKVQEALDQVEQQMQGDYWRKYKSSARSAVLELIESLRPIVNDTEQPAEPKSDNEPIFV